MNNYRQRQEDCKSSIIGSIPIRASIADNWLTSGTLEVFISDFLKAVVDIRVNCTTGKVALRFKYKSKSYSISLNTTLTELTESDVQSIVEKKIQAIDRVITLQDLLDFIESCDDCGGNSETRHKACTGFKDLAGRDNLNLDSPTSVLLQLDDMGRTIPERWSEIYGLPHKLRQIKSLFSRKNIRLFMRKGWDTNHFSNFVGYVAASVVSQPFTTTDSEVEKIKLVFAQARHDNPIFYDIYMLAFGAGLRQSEIYQVHYEHFTTFNGQHYLLLPFATKRSKLKGTNHIEKVGISSQLYNHFQCREKSGQVILGGKRLHKRFVRFLRDECGIEDIKPCHRLRKILGARLATTAGIYHAAKTLRNSVGVAEKYYSDLTCHQNELEI